MYCEDIGSTTSQHLKGIREQEVSKKLTQKKEEEGTASDNLTEKERT